MEKIKLFCIPYAGGSNIIYKKWPSFLNDNIQLIPVELAGRGNRSDEPLYKNLVEAINDIYKFISDKITAGKPYALCGHSMGAMLAYEVAQKIKEKNMPQPTHAIFMGKVAPHIKSERKKIYHTMQNEEFQNEIRNLGGTPKEFFKHPDLMDYMLPILKNDFKMVETAIENPVVNPFNYDITIFMGKEEAGIDKVDEWKLHTTKICNIYLFNGGHFFLNSAIAELVATINNILAPQTIKYPDNLYNS